MIITSAFNNINFSCSECKKIYSRKNTMRHNNKRYCLSCLHKKFNVCELCTKVVSETLTKFRRKKLCNKCLKHKKIKCLECGKVLGKWEAHGVLIKNLCEDCYNLRYRRFRTVNLPQRKVPSSTFNKNNSRRYCGVEIECRNHNRDKNCFVRKELKDLKFSQVRDGSLNLGGIEFVSKPMNGDLLFNSIENLCKILNKKKYFVDRSCGLHIHLEVQKKVEYLKKLYLFYEKFEPIIFKMVPKSRQSTGYCMKFNKVYHHDGQIVFGIDSLPKFKSMIYETKSQARIKSRTSSKWGSKRYCWTNFHSIFYRKTLEIRNHSGTISAKKINNWIRLHLDILNYLNKVDLQTINDLGVDKKTFLSLFKRPLQQYIKERWVKFGSNPLAKEGN